MKKKLWLVCLSFSVLLLFTGCSTFNELKEKTGLFEEKEDLLKEGTELLKEQKYEEAITTFETAIEQEEEESEAFRGVGIAQYEQGNYEDALKAFEQALEFEDAVKTPTIYNLMGICSMKLTDYQGAANNFKAGILVGENTDAQESKVENEDVNKAENKAENKNEGKDEGKDESKDYAEVMKEMRYNLIVSYEKMEDWGNAKQAAADYLEQYPDDEAVRKEAIFLETR